MTTSIKRWPMIGPPSATAINPTGYGRANPPAIAESRASVKFSNGLRVAVETPLYAREVLSDSVSRRP